MTELERALVLLGHELELPPTPDVAAAIRPRLARRRRGRWAAAVALAALAVALAVPGSRSALLRVFQLEGATVVRVDRLPTLPATTPLGRRIDPRDASFRLLLLDGRTPETTYAGDGGYWLRYPGALVYEVRSGSASILKKVAAMDTSVEWVTVGGDPGIWIGARHAVYLPGGAARTAGHVLLWQHGALTLRLETGADREHAVASASRFR